MNYILLNRGTVLCTFILGTAPAANICTFLGTFCTFISESVLYTHRCLCLHPETTVYTHTRLKIHTKATEHILYHLTHTNTAE